MSSLPKIPEDELIGTYVVSFWTIKVRKRGSGLSYYLVLANWLPLELSAEEVGILLALERSPT